MKRIVCLFALIGILLCFTENARWENEGLAGSSDEASGAYQSFLSRQIYASDKHFPIKILPRPHTEYLMVDMNEDNIPELAVKSCILQYYTPDRHETWATVPSCAIFTFEDGEIKLWSTGDHYADFEILNNCALLYIKEDSGSYQYDYVELDCNGDLEYSIRLHKQMHTSNGQSDEWVFSLLETGAPNTNGYRIVGQEEWNQELEAILKLRTDRFAWERVETTTPEWSCEASRPGARV